jgi:hypothetical protein
MRDYYEDEINNEINKLKWERKEVIKAIAFFERIEAERQAIVKNRKRKTRPVTPTSATHI